MRFQTVIFLLTLLLFSPVQPSISVDRYQMLSWRSVKLRVVKKEYDYFRPWLAPKIRVEYASGLYLGSGRILANLAALRGLASASAHFVSDSKAYPLKVEHVGYDCGLLLLRFDLPKTNKKSKKAPSKKKTPSNTKNKLPKKEGHDDTKPRRLDLRLLRKADTDIPFIQLEEKPKKEDTKKTEETQEKDSIRAIYLEPLAFALNKPKSSYYALAPAYNAQGHLERLKARFFETEFQKLDGSDIDAHWTYPLLPVQQAFQMSYSGAPVLFQERLVGILHVSNGKRAYVISASTIRAFLDDIKDGRYDGLRSSGLLFEKIQNEAERSYLGLTENTGALRVTGFAAKQVKGSVFEKGDILLSIDGVSLDKNGFLSLENRKWNVEEYLRTQRRKNRQVKALVLRATQRQVLLFETQQSSKKHPGRSAWNRLPRYFLGAGLVFVELNYDLVHSPGLRSNVAIQKAYQKYILSDYLENRRPILLLKRFADFENKAARSFRFEILRMINGRRVFDLVGLSREWKRSRDSFVLLEFYGREDKLVLPFYEKNNINNRVTRRYLLQENARVP